MTDMARVMQGVIPYLSVDRADKAIEFYEKAFGAKDLGTMRTEDGKHIMHCQLEINGGALMLSDAAVMEGKQVPSDSYTMQLVVGEGDMWWNRAVDAGCVVEIPFEMQFWGDRWGKLRDPFDISWALLEPGPGR
jgi:PhnB protein